ncbi:MAG: hypothetical protein KAX80_08820, partial [Planctomycetes bacterium]|nr:hypothetical protein [Planctomycetota bacterium]
MDWSDASSDNPRTDTGVTANINVTANFAQDEYTVTASADPNGTIDPNGAIIKNAGEDQLFTATPNTGYTVDIWYLDGNSVQTGGTTYTLTNIQADHAVLVTFEFEQLPSVDDVANSDIPVSGTVSGSYTDTQTSNDGYESITEEESGGKPENRYSYLEHKWTINVIGGDTVTFYVEAHHTANTENDDFVFAYSTDDSTYTDMLTVTNTTDANTYQSYGMPNDINGPVYIRVMDTDQSQGNRTLDTIYVDHMYIKSTFAQPKYTITATAAPNGSIDPNGVIVKNAGEDQLFTASPNGGYTVDTWYVDGNSVQVGGTTYTLTNIQANHTVYVTFTESVVQYSLNPSSTAGGSVTNPGEAGPYTYDAGTVVTLTAEYETNYHFVNWTGDTAGINNVNLANTTVTMNDNYTIQANFAIDTHTVT